LEISGACHGSGCRPAQDAFLQISVTKEKGMIIDGNTNVAALIEEHPELIETLAGISPHFRKLENRFLRKPLPAG